ncbi:HigA family addiction module antitoxin [Aurantimonas sp. 22II-16-19i]|uniref:HigA family addiction module antitoxin n=1 Tax=Aurantimonas sp. 22II-16-19i TaxID=1317114 RepID=UPI0009F7AD00|nr:HigA family addiction module antitoxin [Aurantimonas sp. 22II-16-19i]ORE97206.1 addiction module antidote protein [Aurantimonas sp. 22II-16-19i]
MSLRFARPIHPGEYLREEYLVPLAISAGALAKRLDLPRTRIERLIREEVGVTPDTALRLARVFDTTPQFWLNLQNAYDLHVTGERLGDVIAKIAPLTHPDQAA